MCKTPTGLRTVLLIAAAWISGCSDFRPPTAPPPPPPPPPPIVQGTPPVITGISPATSSTAGGASMRIVGTSIRPGAVAIIDGVTVNGRVNGALTMLSVETPPHADGTVDIEVRNVDGTSTTVVAAHRYAPAASFDLNGEWSGFPGNGDDRGVAFTVASGRLVSAFCDNDVFAHIPIPPAAGVAVRGGEFTIVAGERTVFHGRIVSPTEALGTMDFDTCSTAWRATRR